MPNHITNLITFRTDNAAKTAFRQMLQDIRADDGVLGSVDFNKLVPIPKELDITSGSRTDKGLAAYQDYRAKRTDILKASPFLDKSDMTKPDDKLCEMLYNCDPGTLDELIALEEDTKQLRDKDPEMWELGRQADANIQQYGFPTWYEWSSANWGTTRNAYGYHEIDVNANTLTFLTAWNGVPNLIKRLSERYPDQTITYSWASEDIGRCVGTVVLKNGKAISGLIPRDGTKQAFEMCAKICGINLADHGYHLNKDRTNYEYDEDDDLL